MSAPSSSRQAAIDRIDAARLVRRGRGFSLPQRFAVGGPKGRRTAPVLSMLSTDLNTESGPPEFPYGFDRADDVVFMPLQCSTPWDTSGRIFGDGTARNGRRVSEVMTGERDQVTVPEAGETALRNPVVAPKDVRLPPPLRPGDIVEMTVEGIGGRIVAGTDLPAVRPARPRECAR
ncbi:hypothetical protein [Actinomadura keratinilytica]|uniref:Uncharacterized protein n=1 Tax=Actinomadura keratinilytica TaxID=547461 RepID=A0ABP7Z5Y4_9ACTN